MAGIVLSFDEVTARYAIKLEATGESVRVLAKNLKPSIFMPGLGVTSRLAYFILVVMMLPIAALSA